MAVRAEIVAARPRPHATTLRGKRIRLSLVPLITVLLIILVGGAYAAGQGGVLNLAFPLAALTGAAVIYWRQPAAYLAYAWWIWMLSPFVRRLADVQAGWNEMNPISLAPLLVTAVTLPTLLRHLPRFRHRALVPFLLMTVALIYGLAVGSVRAAVPAAAYAAATWFLPMMLGAYLIVHWERYPEHRESLGKAFIWGLIITGVYGVYQFISPPQWDRYWMMQSQMDSIGRPEPFAVRVFSMMNAPGPFAYVIEGALLLMLAYRGRFRTFAIVAGTAAFLLSLVRSAWLGILLGFALYFIYAPWRNPGRAIIRGAATITAIAVLAFGASFFLPTDRIREAAAQRMATLTNISGDYSYRERKGDLGGHLENIGQDFVGEGLGSTGTSVGLNRPVVGIRDFDNGVLEIFYALGWIGGLLFVAGLGWFVVPLLRKGEERHDDFARAARAAGVAILCQAIFGNVFANVSAAIMWTCLGLHAASRRYARESPALRRAVA